jgi:hypothetical protein
MENEKSKELRLVRVFLYESFLEETKGKFYARLAHERTLSVGDVCDIAKERGGLPGDPRVMEDNVHRFFDEMSRQVCNGLTVNMAGYLSASARVGGIFERLREGVTPEKHPVEICYRTGVKFHEAAETVEVFVEGLAPSRAFIDEFTDVKTKLVNQKATIGGQFVMTGDLLKIFGPSAKNGLRFTAPGAPAIAVKVATDDLAVNESRRIIGVVPELLPDKPWTLEITTQYGGSSVPLKEPRVIRSDFTLSV